MPFFILQKCAKIRYMKNLKPTSKRRLPEMFRPLLWGLKWDALDVWEDREDIILAALNYGELEHLRWIIETYGKNEIRRVLVRRLETEIYPESRNLARVLFSVPGFRKSREDQPLIKNSLKGK